MHHMIPKDEQKRQDDKILRHLRNVRVCPWCLDVNTEGIGVCADCERRIELANHARKSGVVVLAIPHIAKASHDLQVMSLLQDEGAIACWTRPSPRGYAAMLGVGYQTVMRSLRHMVKLGWLEKRGHVLAEYRVATLPLE